MEKANEITTQISILSEGTAEILPSESLQEKIKTSIQENRPLRIKLGIDPTTKDVHIGHMVPYKKLRQFQDLGHTAVLIIGDFTAMIGDPTGKNKERPRLSFEQIKINTETYCSQIFKVIDESKAEVHYQSDWFSKASLKDAIEKAAEFSVAHLLSHETFRSRLDSGERLSLHEMFYPVLQAWDSLAIDADIELGGMDQKFNILCGRDLQRNTGRPPQTAMFLPLLPGTDGKKMSKTGGNSINVLDTPEEMYAKVMSISDDLLMDYQNLASGLCRTVNSNPYILKKLIAKDIVETYHGFDDALQAEDYFSRTVSQKTVPETMPEIKLSEGLYPLIQILTENKLASSNSESRRLIQQGGVQIDGKKITDISYKIQVNGSTSLVVRAGKRKFIRIRNLL